ncbi:MAG: hypothetical protein IT356_10290 [Gemmatimonadaceae bacterium]|nr:hypothetical protein [Gemmatimonadaceae bacterium]
MSSTRSFRTALLVAPCVALSAAPSQSLRGSRESVERQHGVAVSNDFTFLVNASDVARFVRLGLLVRVKASAGVDLAGVSHPYARPATRLFVQRLGAQHRAACGEPLTVTSLTRPSNSQPANASGESVHPTGMAVDLRVSSVAKCRQWLDRVLLSLERTGVIEATREHRPPHYHVAVFPQRYTAYVRGLATRSVAADIMASGDDGSGTGGAP